jgi:AraC-like DNA-binding protein
VPRGCKGNRAVPSCEIRNFTEPYEFAAALRESDVDLTLLEPGRFSAGITDISLGSLNIKRISESMPRIMHWTNSDDRATFMFHTVSGPSVIHDGIEVNSNNIVRTGRQTSHFQRSFGPVTRGSISLPLAEVVSLGQAMTGVELAQPANEQISVSRPAVLANIQRLHAALGLIARDAPEIIENPDAARGLEQALKQVLGACLDDNGVLEQRSTRNLHQKIMRRYHAVLEANVDRPIYVLEMAKAVGASVRSLTMCCHEYLGMGPKRYLMLRRMHLARQALLMASPSAATVTDVATLYGFWQFGRFAGQYKSLFGESPSVTLRRS